MYNIQRRLTTATLSRFHRGVDCWEFAVLVSTMSGLRLPLCTPLHCPPAHSWLTPLPQTHAPSALNISVVSDIKPYRLMESIAIRCMFLESLHHYCSIAKFVRRYPVFPPAGDAERRNRRLHGCAKAKGLITFGSINSKLGDVVQFIASLARYSMVLGSLTTYDGLDRPSSKEIIVITATIRHPVTECILFGPKSQRLCTAENLRLRERIKC